MTDLAGAMIQLYAYDAYGNAVGFDPATALTEFLYSGEQFDAKIGQQYLRQRYYDPSTGRFNRLDPFFGNHADPQSFHKYLYTHADPVNLNDPNGLFGGLIGGIGGMLTCAKIALPIVGTLATVGGVVGYYTNSSGYWWEGFIPGWGAGRGFGQSLQADDYWGMAFNGAMLLLDFFSFGGGSLVFGSAKNAPKILKAVPAEEITKLYNALKKTIENPAFTNRLIVAGYNPADIVKLLGRVKEYYKGVGNKSIQVIEQGYPWIDDQIIALSKNAMSKMSQLTHELTHLLDDIVNPGILEQSRKGTASWWTTVKTEYNAWFTHSRFAWYTIGGSYKMPGIAYGAAGGSVTTLVNKVSPDALFFFLKNILYPSTAYSGWASQDQNWGQ